jgi:hypothetical protein
MEFNRKENYCKYSQVQNQLLKYLEDGVSAKLTAKLLHISLPTFYKYKSIASIETGKIYTVQEETAFMEREKRKRDKDSLLNQKYSQEKNHDDKKTQDIPEALKVIDLVLFDPFEIQDKNILHDDASQQQTINTITPAPDTQTHKRTDSSSALKENKK